MLNDNYKIYHCIGKQSFWSARLNSTLSKHCLWLKVNTLTILFKKTMMLVLCTFPVSREILF